MADKRDYYEVLGLSKGASDDEIKKSYRKLAKQYQSTVMLQCGERRCDVKQLIKLMLAAVKQGETVCITVSGMDEEACAAALEKAMQQDF